MKKLILLLFLLCCFKEVHGVYFYYGDELVPNMYMVRDSGTEAESSAVYLVKRVDTKEFAYCIEPLKLLNRDSNYIEYNYNNKTFNLADEVVKKINLIAYYGYKYPKHEDIKWYGITQYLIWKTIYPNYNFYFASRRFGDKVNTYDNEIKELSDLVNSDLKGIEINNYYTLRTGRENVFLESDLLNNYYVASSDTVKVKINNGKLIASSDKTGYYTIKLRRINWRTNSYFLYDSYDAQDLFINGFVDDEITIYIKFINNKLTVYKEDYDDNYSNLSIDGAIYSIYDDYNNEIMSKEVIDGKTEFFIPSGTYYLKEKKPSYGYLIDDTVYKIDVYDDMEYKVYDKKDYKKVIIHKKYSDNNILFNESNATFEIYLADYLVGTYITDEEGIIELNLPYGNYLIKQISGLDNYYLADDFNLIIDENYESKSINIINYQKEEPLKKEVLGENVVVLKYIVPDTSLNKKHIYYPFYIFIKILLYVFKKVYL